LLHSFSGARILIVPPAVAALVAEAIKARIPRAVKAGAPPPLIDEFTSNEYYAINEGNAQGLPV
jgi:hypothetical protein